MKGQAIMIGMVSTLALAAPVALALPARPSPRQAPTHPKSAAHPVAPKHAPANPASGLFVAPFPSTPIVTPRYIYIPAAAANFPVVVADCQNTESNCTDQQLCEYWGIGCPAYAPTGAPADPAVATPP